MSEEVNEVKEVVAEEPQETKAKLGIGLTPFGHIGINIQQADGTSAGYVLSDLTEASNTAMHLHALVVMMIQGMYAQAIEEQNQIKALLDKPQVWTP
jgi:hypothetical protein